MARSGHAPRRPQAEGEVSVAAWEADLFQRIAQALAKDDQRAQRLRQAIHSAARSQNTDLTKLQNWLTALEDGEE